MPPSEGRRPVPRRVLVTGATGFVGEALCAALVARGFAVRRAVRRAAPLPAGAPPGSVEDVHVGDVGPDTAWGAALAGVDTVVHLAGRAHVMNDPAPDPLAEYRRVNVGGTAKLARQAAAAGVRRVVFVSSVKVNGEATSGEPFRAGDRPEPLDAYGRSKCEAEQVLREVARDTGIEAVVVRPPLIYGPGVKANFLRLMESVERGVPLPFGKIANQRSLLYVGNLADALVACVEHPAAAGQTFLVADGAPVATPELVRNVAAALGRRPRVFSVPETLLRLAGRVAGRAGTVQRLLGSLVVDEAHIRRTLGWHPPYTMREGLAETARWFGGRKAAGGTGG